MDPVLSASYALSHLHLAEAAHSAPEPIAQSPLPMQATVLFIEQQMRDLEDNPTLSDIVYARCHEVLLASCLQAERGDTLLARIATALLGRPTSFEALGNPTALLDVVPQSAAYIVLLSQVRRLLAQRDLERTDSFPALASLRAMQSRLGRLPQQLNFLRPQPAPPPPQSPTAPSSPQARTYAQSLQPAGQEQGRRHGHAESVQGELTCQVPGMASLRLRGIGEIQPTCEASARALLATLLRCPLGEEALSDPVFNRTLGRSVNRAAAQASRARFDTVEDFVMAEVVSVCREAGPCTLTELCQRLQQTLRCPITLDLLEAPRIDACGHAFGAQSVAQAILYRPACPLSRAQLMHCDLRPHATLSALIAWLTATMALLQAA